MKIGAMAVFFPAIPPFKAAPYGRGEGEGGFRSFRSASGFSISGAGFSKPKICGQWWRSIVWLLLILLMQNVYYWHRATGFKHKGWYVVSLKLQCIKLHCTALNYIKLHYIELHYITIYIQTTILYSYCQMQGNLWERRWIQTQRVIRCFSDPCHLLWMMLHCIRLHWKMFAISYTTNYIAIHFEAPPHTHTLRCHTPHSALPRCCKASHSVSGITTDALNIVGQF